MIYKCMPLLFILLFFSCTNPSSDPDTAIWEKVTSSDGSVPVERHEAAFVGVGDKFYLLGGRDIRPVSIFDTKTKTWTKGTPPPLEIHHFQPIVYNDRICLMGAMTGPYPTEKPVPNIMIYDTQKDTWVAGAEIPVDRRRGGAGAVVYNGKFYMVCGIRNGHIGDHKNWLDCYDPQTGAWTKLPDAPRPRDHFQAVVADDKLYVLAGRMTKSEDNPFKNTIGEVDVFDFKTQKWSTLENHLPTLRAGNAALLYKEEILVIGGESFTQEKAHNEVEALHIEKEVWRSLSPMLEGRHGTSAVLYKNGIYLASGCGNRGGNPELTTMECLHY